MNDLIARLRPRLSADRGVGAAAPPLLEPELKLARPAAVLVPLLRESGEWRLLFTERPHDLPEHAGQVSFPGGGVHAGDADPAATALREAHEEVGLRPETIEIVGTLPPRLTITDYWLTPVVGIIPWPERLVLSPREVAEVFTVPVAWLADPANREVRLRHHPRRGPDTPVLYYHWPGHLIWGLTARIVSDLLDP